MPTATQQISIKELSALYDRIYNIADRLFKKYNPCNIHKINGVIYCTAYKNKKDNELRQKRSSFLCCGGCCYGSRINYSSLSGCTTKCLACKLYICPSVRNKRSHVYYKLLKIRKYADRHGLLIEKYYLSKEDWLKRIKE